MATRPIQAPVLLVLGVLLVSCGGPPERSTPVDPVQSTPPSAERGTTEPAQVPARDEAPGQGAREPSRTELVREAGRVLDEWHAAAAVGDRDRYLAHFAPDAVFLGTDASERWSLAQFTAYVDEHFEPGSGWAYTPSDRHVVVGPNARVAWFDEALESAGYGALRGTGALRREGDTWRIAHYSMTFTIPNEVAKDVVRIVRESGL